MTGFGRTILLLSILLLSGCVSVELGDGEDRTVSYVFTDARPALSAEDENPLPATLIIQSLDGDPMANSVSIVYSREPGQRELYQLSFWNERPVQALPRLLMQRLNGRGTYRSVAALGEGVGGELGLGVGIESIYHDASTSPGNVRLIVRVDLIERASRELLARRNFAAQVDLEDVGPASVVEAMSLAVAEVFDDIEPWLKGETAKALTE